MLCLTMLQPLDLLLCLKLSTYEGTTPGYEMLSSDLKIGLAGAYRSVKRLIDAGLVSTERKVSRAALLEFTLHGARYAYYVKLGEPTRGVPTAHAAPPLALLITPGGDAPVWPDPAGTVRGVAVKPLHKAALTAAKSDPRLYEL